jgi:hypothetical protein
MQSVHITTKVVSSIPSHDKVCQWLADGQWFSPGTLVSSTNKTDCLNKTEILLKVVTEEFKFEMLKEELHVVHSYRRLLPC